MDGDGFAEDLVRPKKPPAPGVEGSKDIDDTHVNTFVITACNDLQYSVEEPYLQQGLLTYYVLEAGYGSHTDLNGNGYLSAEEVFAYLEPWVTSYWGDFGAGYNRQYPQSLDTNEHVEIHFMTAPSPRASTVFLEDDLDEDPEWEIVPDDVMPRWQFGEPLGCVVLVHVFVVDQRSGLVGCIGNEDGVRRPLLNFHILAALRAVGIILPERVPVGA